MLERFKSSKIVSRFNCRMKKGVEENVDVCTNAMNIVRISEIVRYTFLNTG